MPSYVACIFKWYALVCRNNASLCVNEACNTREFAYDYLVCYHGTDVKKRFS